MHKSLAFFSVLYLTVGAVSFLDGMHDMIYQMQSQAEVFLAFCIGYAALHCKELCKPVISGFCMYTLYIMVTDIFMCDVTILQWMCEILFFSVFTCILYIYRNKLWRSVRL